MDEIQSENSQLQEEKKITPIMPTYEQLHQHIKRCMIAGIPNTLFCDFVYSDKRDEYFCVIKPDGKYGFPLDDVIAFNF